MMRLRPASRALAAALLALTPALSTGCASSEPKSGEWINDPDLTADERAALAKIRADEAERENLPKVLLQIDKALDSYVRALSGAGVPSQDERLQQLDRLLRQMVNGKDEALSGQSTAEYVRQGYSQDMPRYLTALASDSSHRRQQGIALSALGFLETGDPLPELLSAAQLDDAYLVDCAVLGLAIKRDPDTPPGIVAAVVLNEKFPEQTRIQAAWALYVLQQSTLRADEVPPVWERVLSGDDTWHPLIVSTAVRGLGLTRDSRYADLVTRHLSHPTARVRFNAAIALGRMNAQDHYEDLIGLLGPQETGANVRLAARKALQALAGGTDRGYDIDLWRREFERNSK